MGGGATIGLLSAVHPRIHRGWAGCVAVGVEHRSADVAVGWHVLLHDAVVGAGGHRARARAGTHRRNAEVSLVPLLQFAVSQVLYLLLPEHLLLVLLADAGAAHQSRRGRQLRAPNGLILYLRRMHLIQCLLLERSLLHHLLLVVSGLAGGLLPGLRRVGATDRGVERPRTTALHYVLDKEALIFATISWRKRFSLLEFAVH